MPEKYLQNRQLMSLRNFFPRASHDRHVISFHNVQRLKLTEQVLIFYIKVKKGKAVLLQASSGPEGSRKLRFPDYMTTAQDGDQVVSPTHRPPLPPGNIPGTQFC